MRVEYKKVTGHKKMAIVKDWLKLGVSYDNLAAKHDTTRHIVRRSIQDYLANTMTKKDVKEW